MTIFCVLLTFALLIVVAAFVSRERAWRELFAETDKSHSDEMFHARDKLLNLEAKLRRIQELTK